MTAFTISSNVNWDDASLVTRAGNTDTYAIANARLTIDTDTRYCKNATTSSGNIGGISIVTPWMGNNEVYVDGSKVRIIPFSSSAGNVPAIGTTITQGAVTSELLGVWSAFNVSPTISGSIMPGSGYLKVKNVVSGNYTIGAFSGLLTASATGPDTVGWIEVVGVESSTYTINNKGKFTVRGEWFEHSTLVTTGVSSSTYQLPASLANTHYAGVWVETAASSSVYELYPSFGSYVATSSVAPDTVRGKVCWISSQGLVRLGTDGTNTNGHLPETGRKIRVPNINFISCVSSSLTVNTAPHSNMSFRPEFATVTGGIIDIDKCNMSWYPNFTQAFSVSIKNTAIHDNMNIADVGGTPFILENMAVGLTELQAQQPACTLSTTAIGGSVTDCTFLHGPLTSSAYCLYINIVFNLTVTRTKVFSVVRNVVTAYSLFMTDVRNTVFRDCVFGTGQFAQSVATDLSFYNTTFFEHTGGPTRTIFQTGGCFTFINTTNGLVDGWSWGGLDRAQTPSYIFNIGIDNRNIIIRNIGSPTTPLDCGGPERTDVQWTRSGTTATVTASLHGLSMADLGTVYVRVVSDLTSITAAVKTILSVPTPDTFTFTCVAGTFSSGTLSYYPVVAQGFLIANASTATENVTVQNCYFSHCRVGTFLGDNAWTDVKFNNVWGETWHPALQFWSDTTPRGCKGGPAFTAQTACFGNHWMDYWITELSPNTISQSWTRSGTVLAVTSSGHSLRANADIINVKQISDSATLTRDFYQRIATTQNSNVFTITCFAAGATSGTLSFDNQSGVVALQMNEPSTTTSGSYVTIDSGAPMWTGLGSLYAPVSGSQVTWEMPDYVIGHTSFLDVPFTCNLSVTLLANFDIFYQIDLNNGAGYSGWKNLFYTRTGGSITVGGFTVTMTSTSGLHVGDYVSRNGLAGYVDYGARIVSVDSSTQITIDRANLVTTSGIVLAFRHFPGEILDPEKGFKLKVRVKTITAHTNLLSFIGLYTTSTTASRAYQYPLSGLVPANTLWNASVGDIVIVTPVSSSASYRADVVDRRFPVQDPISASLSRYEYNVIYCDLADTVATSPWKHIWTTATGYVPVYSELPFVSGSAISGSISKLVTT